MTESKAWYRSRTIIASIVTVAAAIAGLAGVPVSDADSSALADLLLQALTAVAGIAAILGRVAASARIG